MIGKHFRGYLLTGLVVWVPILVTIGVLRFIVDLLDDTLALLPGPFQPEYLLGQDIPGVGAIISLMILLVTGVFATNFFGQKLVGWGESLLARIPLVRSIYNATKQVINALLSNNGQAFRKVLMVQFPRQGSWSLAFLTADAPVNEFGAEMVCVFVPTTPNPTSGFFMMMPKSEVIELDMSVDEALKCIISLGVMQPSQFKKA